jgi:hypothetical protein
MLWTLLASALLLAGRTAAQVTCATGTPMTQSGSNNFVIDSFSESLMFTYAINQCTGVNIVDNGVFYKYTCSQDENDMWWVTKTSYSTSDCTGSGTVVSSWSEEDTVAGEEGYFKCDGKNNYAAIEIGLDSQCGGTVTLTGGLGACASNPDVLDTKFYCDDTTTTALVQLYYNPDKINSTLAMCSDDLYCNKWSFTSTCKPVAQLFGQLVYGKYSDCALTEATNPGYDGGDDSDSSASSMTLLGVVVSLIFGLFH